MRIGFIGTGAMAQAIARGAVASGVDPATLVFSNRTATKACDLADELGATAASSKRVPGPPGRRRHPGCQAKDQRTVIKEIAPVVVGRTDVCIVSLAAGRTPRPDHPGGLRIGYSTDPRHAPTWRRPWASP